MLSLDKRYSRLQSVSFIARIYKVSSIISPVCSHSYGQFRLQSLLPIVVYSLSCHNYDQIDYSSLSLQLVLSKDRLVYYQSRLQTVSSKFTLVYSQYHLQSRFQSESSIDSQIQSRLWSVWIKDSLVYSPSHLQPVYIKSRL